MKKILVAIMAMFLFIGCGSPEKEAEKVAIKFTEYFFESNTEEVFKLIYLSEQDLAIEGIEELVKGKLLSIMGTQKEKIKKMGGVKSITALSSKISEDKNTAIVELEIIFKNKEVKLDKIKLKKDHKDNWKVKL
ncbi:DUF4878 domain-containing protein [Campylobacter sp. FMV-PI01]|uniref:DUF4878 domain-containing protein n=1 Tax=Campylobacter portucalensis TaxID=2608384 RepID=A0A6L5WKQ2_9BACT|nr:DUF4878 domain-containing protein [Campylobacter portucalensis]MSN96827.1 DUF4878 domain-containing protein [Campylobacter portucalensis]